MAYLRHARVLVSTHEGVLGDTGQHKDEMQAERKCIIAISSMYLIEQWLSSVSHGSLHGKEKGKLSGYLLASTDSAELLLALREQSLPKDAGFGPILAC